MINLLRSMYVVVVKGGGKGVKRRRSRNPVLDFLNLLDVWVFGFFDWIDSIVLYQGRNVRAPWGRARSNYEVWVGNLLVEHGIRFIYEPMMVLDLGHGRTSRVMPDFVLPDYGNTVIEIWGVPGSNLPYHERRKKKMGLYLRSRTPLISLFPRDFKEWHLEEQFACRFSTVTGKPFPPRLKGE